MRMRSIVVLMTLALLGAVGCRAEEEPEVSPTPDATEAPEVQLEGTVLEVLSPTDAGATDDAVDDDASPEASPAATGAGGGILVQLTALSESLEECGLDSGDNVAVFWTSDAVVEPATVQRDSEFPENLSGHRVLATGQVDEVAGQCVLVATRLEVAAAGSPSPRVSPTPDDDDDEATARPTTRPTASPTPRPTAAATPEATADNS